MIENKPNLGYIDCLRGVAIMMVVCVHVAINIDGLNGTLLLLGKYGQMGVQLFFLTSAITLCLSLNRSINTPNWLASFYIKRYFRIAPLYYIGILIYFSYYYSLSIKFHTNPLFVELSNNYTTLNIIANVFFVHGFYAPANNVIVAGGWSIGTEMAFYIIFPVVFIIISKVFKRIKNLPTIVGLYLILIALNIFAVNLAGSNFSLKSENNTFLYYNLLNQLPVFLTGIFLFFILDRFKIKIDYRVTTFSFLITTGIAVFYYKSFNNITIAPLLSAISFVFLFFLFKDKKSFNILPLKRIGQLSFSIYIFHFIFAETLSKIISKRVFKSNHELLSFITSYILVLIISVIIASLSEKFIERKGIDFGKSLIREKG